MTTDPTIRLGVIGLGNIAQQHIQHIQSGLVPGCRVAAVCSRNPHPLAAELGVPHFGDYRELVDAGVCDAVLIATPTFAHLDSGCYSLAAGLHVLMEKPLGLSLAEGGQLLAARAPGQVFALMLNQRTDPLFVRMRDIVQSGELGTLVRCSWTMTHWFRPEVYFQVSDWRATWRGEGGGLLVNQCIHNLDIFQWLVGMPERLRAFCQFGKYHDIEVEDEATAYLEFTGGASGVFVGSTGEAPGCNRLEIVGDRGSLLFDGTRLQRTHNTPGTAEYSRGTRDMFGMPETRTEDITPDRSINQHAAVLANFCAAITRGEPLIADAAEGLDSLALANAMLLSTWDDASVSLPLDSTRYQRALDQRIQASSLRQRADIEANIDMSQSYR
ncbi:Gfo/Idh/MocA family protein [Parahaliea aestuarii]|uniref:Gfo/Idh/MocA family oxidoreductase n=1 Tax=Parahaliea aestuarii TaxID=1852021 RepID=A0A5C8ZPZ7_9GAMM|nr:Gfo/Idh/MocA family oxidoreductase [Parahaliea aestuarii]TXS90556.1 Gfo/Idh/MocA family oxidoreductase [Parahaliea aestuarii]